MSIAEKLTAVAENVPKVYEAGKKAQYGEFWNSYSSVADYVALFAGRMWNDTTFKPKQDIFVNKKQANMMFYNNACTNIKQSLIDCGVRLDLSQATQANQTFCYCKTTELPEIDLSNATSLTATFQSATKLVSIDKVIFKEGIKFATTTFSDLSNLENITIGGAISGSGFDIHWSTKLSAKSLYSIINALSTSTSGLTVTLPTTAEANYNADPPAGAPQTWAALIATRQNWTFAYA